jgi:hypothetical protein
MRVQAQSQEQAEQDRPNQDLPELAERTALDLTPAIEQAPQFRHIPERSLVLETDPIERSGGTALGCIFQEPQQARIDNISRHGFPRATSRRPAFAAA